MNTLIDNKYSIKLCFLQGECTPKNTAQARPVHGLEVICNWCPLISTNGDCEVVG